MRCTYSLSLSLSQVPHRQSISTIHCLLSRYVCMCICITGILYSTCNRALTCYDIQKNNTNKAASTDAASSAHPGTISTAYIHTCTPTYTHSILTHTRSLSLSIAHAHTHTHRPRTVRHPLHSWMARRRDLLATNQRRTGGWKDNTREDAATVGKPTPHTAHQETECVCDGHLEQSVEPQ